MPFNKRLITFFSELQNENKYTPTTVIACSLKYKTKKLQNKYFLVFIK